MNVQAHFTDIASAIVAELDCAQRSIEAAVAWLTDPTLFESLLKAARRGCRVRLALLARGLALMPYEDPELAALRLDLRTLEAQVVALSQEQAETERLIQEFARCQQEALGDLLEESLRLLGLYWQRRAERGDAT